MSRHAESWWHQGPWSWARELAVVAVAIAFATLTDAGEFATGKIETIFRQIILAPLRRGHFFQIRLAFVGKKLGPNLPGQSQVGLNAFLGSAARSLGGIPQMDKIGIFQLEHGRLFCACHQIGDRSRC